MELLIFSLAIENRILKWNKDFSLTFFSNEFLLCSGSDRDFCSFFRSLGLFLPVSGELMQKEVILCDSQGSDHAPPASFCYSGGFL